MSQHQRLKIRASRLGNKAERTLPTFFRTSDSTRNPNQYLGIDECRKLKAEGRGEFINRGKAFRRHDVFESQLPNNSKPSSRRGESLRIDEPAFGSNLGMMSRFVEGDKYAVAAVESWA
jgi:hypothetical protein